ncbi:MAG: glycosyltransferase [Phototrophicaceae bacterium]
MTPLKRIAIISVHASPIAKVGGKKVGGLNVYIREVAKTFARQGLLVDLFTRQESEHQPSVDHSLGEGIRVVQLPAGALQPIPPDDLLPHLQQFAAGVIAFSIRHNIQYDFIFSHYWLSGLVAMRLRETWGTPFAQVFHTLGAMKARIPSTRRSTPHARIHHEGRIIQAADLLIANTVAERAQLLWLYRADRRKIRVSPPGVNLDVFFPLDKTQARDRVNVSKDAFLAVFAGRIEPLKAVDSILDAVALMPPPTSETRPIQVIIIGSDPHDKTDYDIQALIQQAKLLGITDRVTFVPAQAQDQLALYLNAADVLLLPSEYESFGMIALEAMACGTAVIASNVGGLTHLVQDGETGFLVAVREPQELAQRLLQLQSDARLLSQMQQQANAHAQQYAWARIAENLVELFNQTIQHRHQHA